MSTESKRRRLRNLMKKDPHCYWCGCLVILGNRKTTLPNMATLDHIISHNNKNYEKGARNWLVLSCAECNQKRQKEEIKEMPIEELWERSGRYPLSIIMELFTEESE